MSDTSGIPVSPATKRSALAWLKTWGESSAPPTVLATLIASQHLHPPQFLPLTFAPALLFSSYLNLSGYKVDAAGTSAAWSGLYLLLARRRKHPMMQRWGVRGLVRGATMGLCLANVLGGGCAYVFGKRSSEATKDGPTPI